MQEEQNIPACHFCCGIHLLGSPFRTRHDLVLSGKMIFPAVSKKNLRLLLIWTKLLFHVRKRISLLIAGNDNGNLRLPQDFLSYIRAL